MICMSHDQDLLDRLAAALDATRRGAPTKPVSVTLPQPLAEAFRLLADEGVIDNVSTAVSHALEDVLQAHVIGMRLDALYAEHPDARPSPEEVAAMAARLDPGNATRSAQDGGA